MDMWSFATTMYEVYTAKVLFTGRHNNELLKVSTGLLDDDSYYYYCYFDDGDANRDDEGSKRRTTR